MGDVTEWVTEVVNTLGYLGIGLLVALESVFPPLPSEIILPLAGFVAGTGQASLIGMVVAASIGSVVGAWVFYAFGAAVGPHRLRALVVRYGRWFGVREVDLDRAEQWFDHHSTAAVLIGRCVPLVRSLVSLPAGFRRMSPGRFTVCTAIGSTLWNLALIGAGAILGERWEEVGDVVGLLQGAVIVAIVGAVTVFVWRRIVRARVSGDELRPPASETRC